jgi:lipoprotein-anchoring transpeptidase ErfK/SrfK
VESWSIGIGREGEETILGEFTVGEKEEDPMWWRPGQEPMPNADPRNPLGSRWIEWYRDGSPTSYGFHGTNEPDSIGEAESEGCVRLLNEDVELLFEILPLGAPVIVRE